MNNLKSNFKFIARDIDKIYLKQTFYTHTNINRKNIGAIFLEQRYKNNYCLIFEVQQQLKSEQKQIDDIYIFQKALSVQQASVAINPLEVNIILLIVKLIM